MATGVSYLLTFRDSEGARSASLGMVLHWLSQITDLEVIVVEQDEKPRLDSSSLPRGVITHFVFNNGLFNRSWGINVAATHASGEVLVTADADMLMTKDALLRSLTACREHFDAVNPYSRVLDLSESQTQALIQGRSSLPGQVTEQASVQLDGSMRYNTNFCGGICVFRREVYFALGGMDESFVGWGGEDVAMTINLERYSDRLAVQKDTMAYHLWHQRTRDRYKHASYQDNRLRAQAYRTYDEQALQELRAQQRASMGNPELYGQVL